MKSFGSFVGKLAIAVILAASLMRAQVTLVNMVPQARSAETNQDSEPTIDVNPANPLQIAASAFTYDDLTGTRMLGPNAPIYVSLDGGLTWNVVMNVPSFAGAPFPTGDITLHFSETTKGTTNVLYTGILHAPDFNMRVLRSPDYRLPVPMTLLDTRVRNVDQPHTQAATVPSGPDAGKDRVYVGFNNGFGGVHPQTATVDFSLDALIGAPAFNLALIEKRSTGTGGQDGFANVPAIHPDGTVYVVFYGWRSRTGATISDVVVVRDDKWATGPNPFTDLIDAGDGFPGLRVVTKITIPFTIMGQQRTGASNLSIAVDPRNSSRVYIAWADQPAGSINQTLHVRRSTDRGVTWSNDLLTVPNAISPALAINSEGKVGFLYQQLSVPSAPAPRWETHFVRTTDPDATTFDSPGLLLANTSATAPTPTFQPYLGDYDHVVAHDRDFYGIFSASNFPDKANFFPGVIYQRFVDFTTHTLFADAGHQRRVPVSIDPFFFKVAEPAREPALQYAAKFVCGKSEGGVVAPGTYFTAINVHNPLEAPIQFRKKFAVALPGEKAGRVTKFFPAKLGPDEAFEIDCPDILRKAEAKEPFLKGFAVLESDTPLDVVAVYTAAGSTGRVETLDLERVPARKNEQPPPTKPDLIPVPDPEPGIGFCRRRGDKLVVTVKNQGIADAGASVTTVDFGPAGTFSQPTPPIAAGASVDVLIPFPPNCFSPDCNFKITVDSSSQVDESNELNNTANGGCLG